jgi:hypothetical protein
MAATLYESMPVRIRILSLKRTLRIPMTSAKTTETMDAKVLICPIMPRLTPNVLDIEIKKRAVRIPRVLVAKLANIREGMNNPLVEVAFPLWFNIFLLHHGEHADVKSN